MRKWLPLSLIIGGSAALAVVAIARRGDSDRVSTSLRLVRTGAPEPVVSSAASHILRSREMRLSDGSRFELSVEEGWDLSVAAEGLGRARFMARSPDGRLFVPDMIDLSDNRRGRVWALSDYDPATGRFGRKSEFLDGLRNPNSVAFYTDSSRRAWLYVALTDRLVRYAYAPGDDSPKSTPQTLATFPDHGLSYKHGGWHLTRTIAFGGDGQLYVSVGSSCNACEEKEAVRACVLRMNPDGSEGRLFATGLRNAVGLVWSHGKLFATHMGADHLGNDRPDDTLLELQDGKHYGWPYCYTAAGKAWADPKFNPHGSKLRPADVPTPIAAFPAHSAPLGVEEFGSEFLVALHGSGNRTLARGYRIVRVSKEGAGSDFITGFLQGGKAVGRPCGIFRWDERTYFITDDDGGVLYGLRRRR